MSRRQIGQWLHDERANLAAFERWYERRWSLEYRAATARGQKPESAATDTEWLRLFETFLRETGLAEPRGADAATQIPG